MRRLVALLLCGVALAVIAWAFARRGACDAQLETSAQSGDVRCWFRCELGLDAATIAKIMTEQEGFVARCAEHCRTIAALRAELDAMPADAPAERRAGPEARLAEADETCRSEREAHVRRIASMMPPDSARRYLDIVLPRLVSLDHCGAPDAAGRRP